MDYEPVIGLEVHVQLSTRTKLFCSCSTGYSGRPPNTFVCPVCLGLPGVLPVLNAQAVRLAVRTVLGLGGTVASFSKFDRKNYFYPDMPKAYQISQYDRPIGSGAGVQVGGRSIGIHRIHLEEDAGKLVHHSASDRTLVDYNRACVPLLEIVSDPVLHDPEEARLYLTKLKSILEYLQVSDCNMEEGSLRCDANVSVRLKGQTTLGTKAEVKNLNSFKWVARALAHEIGRQVQTLEGGGRVVQETRLFDPDRGITVGMRAKEEAHDYRYFPEPDVPPIELDPATIEEARTSLPELPDAKRARFVSRYGLSEYDAGVLTSQLGLARFFEEAAGGDANVEAVKNWIATELLGRLKEAGLSIDSSKVRPAHVEELVGLIDRKVISGKMAKQVFDRTFASGEPPGAIVKALGLEVIADPAVLEGIVDEVLAGNPESVEAVRKGKEATVQYLVGQVMKKTRGRASPEVANRIIREKVKP